MGAEKALAEMDDLIGDLLTFRPPEERERLRAAARTLARAAFEAGIVWFKEDIRRGGEPKPKWLTETSR